MHTWGVTPSINGGDLQWWSQRRTGHPPDRPLSRPPGLCTRARNHCPRSETTNKATTKSRGKVRQITTTVDVKLLRYINYVASSSQ